MMDARSRNSRRLVLSVGVAALAMAMLAPMASAATPKTKLASQSSAEVQATGGRSYDPDISGTGRFVVFGSQAPNLVSGDGNGTDDIFIRDFKKGTTRLISVASGGGVGDDGSQEPSISTNGRWVAFASDASDLIGAGTNGDSHIFVRDRWMGKTELVSRNNGGAHGNGSSHDTVISGNGRWVAFESEANNLVGKNTKGERQIYLYDRKNDKIILVSRNNKGRAGNGQSEEPAISKNGRYIAYNSEARNLTPKNTRGHEQVYLFDRVTKKTMLMSRNNAGKPGRADSDHPAISGNGKRVVFNSRAKNLIRKDTNGTADAYMRDLRTKKTKRISLNWKGKQLNKGAGVVQDFSDPDISLDGKWISFESNATNATKNSTHPGVYDLVYARNLKNGNIKVLSKQGKKKGNGASDNPELSTTGAFAAFDSTATNLILGGDDNGSLEDVFRRGPIH